jgi:hypothetical protein
MCDDNIVLNHSFRGLPHTAYIIGQTATSLPLTEETGTVSSELADSTV